MVFIALNSEVDIRFIVTQVMDYLHNYFRVLLITARAFLVSVQRTYIQRASRENADYYYVLGLLNVF